MLLNLGDGVLLEVDGGVLLEVEGGVLLEGLLELGGTSSLDKQTTLAVDQGEREKRQRSQQS